MLRISFFGVSSSSLFNWFSFSGSSDVAFSLIFNTFTIEFSLLLLILGFLIHIYSYFYFAKDPDFSRFSVLLGFFIFFMLLLINTDSWVFVFIAWEGVGLLSFLLVSFWYAKVNTFKSGMKVLFYNRIGDFFFFFAIGIILFFFKVDSPSSAVLYKYTLNTGTLSLGQLFTLDFLLGGSLVLVILSKSAQFGFHIWLLEAMEAPLPASSLIHSATLVCAGVVLFFKSFVFISYVSGIANILVFWASATACLLSFAAFLNYDIKKILAYSTGSHVSLMLVLALTSGGSLGYMYTLIHASTKVFIFLLFGFIIDINLGVRDLRKMGGFFRFSDVTYFGCFAIFFLSSLPVFPLAILKDMAIANLLTGNFFQDFSAVFLMGASLFNYLYMSRLFFKIFFGDLLSSLVTYFSNTYFFKNYFSANPKVGNLWVLNSPLLYLFFYILLFEFSIFFFFGIDFGFTENRVINLSSLYPEFGLYRFLSYSNTFFFSIILIKFYSKILR